jgi:7,8-dihydroneopterin aldolase/epimerase/oxygenase
VLPKQLAAIAALYNGWKCIENSFKADSIVDIIFIKALKCETTLGVYDWERVSLRPVLIDLDIGSASNESFVHDSAKGLMNYDSIAKHLTESLKRLHYKTVERLAEHIAQIVISEFHAPYVKVSVGKPAAVKNAAMVGVTIERRAVTDTNASTNK